MKKGKKSYAILILLFAFGLPLFFILNIYKKSYILIKENISNNDKKISFNLSTKIYDVNGDLISELFDENRSFIKLEKVPHHVRNAFLTSEDKNFYSHPGVDLTGIIRALVIDVISGGIKQGGSTITQQLAKQLFTTKKRTLERKIIELFIAFELERKYTKNQILEMYLNKIYLGHGVYGIKSASQFYFEKEPMELGIIEASILSAIPSSPTRNSPIKYPRNAYAKNQQLLDNMINLGHISKNQAIKEFKSFWPVYLSKIRTKFPGLGVRSTKLDRAPHITELIRKKLIKQFGETEVYQSGYKVYTSIDLRHQKIAERQLTEKIKLQKGIAHYYNKKELLNIEKIYASKNLYKKIKNPDDRKATVKFLKKSRKNHLDELNLISILFDTPKISNTIEIQKNEYDNLIKSSKVEGAFVSLNPEDGGILAMIGGEDIHNGNQLNRAIQSYRQPGSAFKAFVYGAGIESKKITAATMFIDLPIIFRDSEETWAPSNYDKTFSGKVSARRALASSLNIISVIVYDEIGGNRITNFASKLLGIPKKRFEIDPSLALGTTEVSPMELTRGYAVIANNGIEVNPYIIKYILDDNDKKIYERKEKKKKKRIISQNTSYILTSMLRGVVDYGTASGAIRSQSKFYLPAAGKTGTNTKFRDAWFVGFTKNLVATVWLGCDSQKFTLGPGEGGAKVAAPIWAKYMREVYEFREKKPFSNQPKTLVKVKICKISGKLPLENCTKIREYFIKDTIPKKNCDSNHKIMKKFSDLVKERKTEKSFAKKID